MIATQYDVPYTCTNVGVRASAANLQSNSGHCTNLEQLEIDLGWERPASRMANFI
jgi:hypothetical protein